LTEFLAYIQKILNFASVYENVIFHINDVKANASLRCIGFLLPGGVRDAHSGSQDRKTIISKVNKSWRMLCREPDLCSGADGGTRIMKNDKKRI